MSDWKKYYTSNVVHEMFSSAYVNCVCGCSIVLFKNQEKTCFMCHRIKFLLRGCENVNENEVVFKIIGSQNLMEV